MAVFKLSSVLACALVAIFQSVSFSESADDGLTIELSTGTILGRLEESKSTPGTYMRVFRGIPYAEPPLGKLRFKAPVPIGNWTGVKNLTDFHVVDCIQEAPILKNVVSEDCLTINVYTPQNVNTSQPLPVMFWIYGGGFVYGTTDPSYQGADFLLDEGLVFVSINYRVSALGFLNLGTADAPGNAGLKDQNLGLQWVKKEISKFGGDPNKVTIFGESAGSASVIFHYLSPKSAELVEAITSSMYKHLRFSYRTTEMKEPLDYKHAYKQSEYVRRPYDISSIAAQWSIYTYPDQKGLFHRAIAQSGNALVDWAFLKTGFLERAKSFSNQINCTKNNTVDINCLQTADVSLYKQYQYILLSEEWIVRGSTFAFVPSLELASDSAFLTDTPINLLRNRNGSNVPLIMGVNHDDGMMELRGDNSSVYAELPSKLKYFVPQDVRANKSSQELTNNAASINSAYLNNTVPGANNFGGYIRLYTDVMFTVSVGQFAKELASQGNVYLYHFDYDGNYRQNNTVASQMKLKGVNHGDQKRYFLTQSDLNQSGTPENVTEKIVLRRMVNLWYNFAKNGNPTPKFDNPVLGNFQWTPVSVNHTNYVIITSNITMSQDNFHEWAIDFWESINKVKSFACRASITLCLMGFTLFITALI